MQTAEDFFETARLGEGFTYVDTLLNNKREKTLIAGLDQND